MSDERQVLERVPAVVYVLDQDRLTYVSPHVETLLGWPAEHFLEDPERWDAVVHADDRPVRGTKPDVRLRDRRGNVVHVRDLRRRQRGRTYGVLVEAPPVTAPPASLRDPVTGLPVAALLREHLALALARANEQDTLLALLHVRVDGLDDVGAGLGRKARAAVVREVAGRMRAALPPADLVAAAGDGTDGSEVMVLLSDLGPDAEQQAELRVGQLLVAAQEPLAVGDHELELSLHAGASVFPRDARDAETLTRHAQAAMHEARKLDGGSRLVVYQGGTTEALERLLVTARLRRALARDELVLHYQPIFRLGDGGVAGVEALLRWESPERGLVPPADFIPLAERTGLIEPIGRWVVGACCAQARAWRDAGHELSMSFNVSLRQFRDPEFVTTLRAAVDEHALDPAQLVVEVTESTAMRDPSCIEPVVRELRALGVRLAIDDFGAGHSSLARLRDLAADQLKIDRDFLISVPGDARAGDLVSAALDLGGALGMSAVAEGVETEQQRRFLVEQGCQLAQGFHLARPAPAGDLEPLLLESTRANVR